MSDRSQRLNVVYIHSHDTGRYMEPYGYPVSMPAYRRFAREGMVFRRAFSASPTCSPSRAALLTGQSPHSAGMLGLAHRGFSLNDPSHHLAAFLREHGYQTILAGHQHLTPADPRMLGYDTVYETSEVSGDQVSANASEFLVTYSKDSDPFFLDVGYSEAHRPFREAETGVERWVSVLPGLPDVDAVRRDTANFHASLTALDRAVGTVVDALDAAGLAERTIVIITTDHGPAFPGYKATLTDGGLGVGLMLRLPGVIGEGVVSDALVSHIDLFPTICDLAGITAPPWIQGASLVPLFQEPQASVRSEVFGEVTFHAAYEPQRSIRTDRWLYIRRFGNRLLPVLPNIDQSPALEMLIENSWHLISLPPVQLFDNLLDPLQRVNLAGDFDTRDVESLLSAQLMEWMRHTGDPLLDGPVPLPAGAHVNRATDRNPDGPFVSEDYV
jgi:arylsulfatase A-like enzyme